MNFEPALIGTAIHLLFWEKLPEWGTWFRSFIAVLPRPLRTLYEQWHCPYCAGFWIALVIHAATGIWTIPALAALPAYWGPVAPFIGWFLDALASATLILAGVVAINAIRLPAMKARLMKDEFMRKAFGGETEEQRDEQAAAA